MNSNFNNEILKKMNTEKQKTGVKKFFSQMNQNSLPPALEEKLKDMERGPIGMQEEARRIRQHLLTCPKCIEEMTNDSIKYQNTQGNDK
jgi:hypothetical protein